MDRPYEASEEDESRRLSQEQRQDSVPVDAPSSVSDMGDDEQRSESTDKPATLPEILPSPTLDFDLSSFIDATPNMDKVNKRASNVAKLAEENQKLKDELSRLSERLMAAEEAAERRRGAKLQQKERSQGIMEPSAT